MSEGCCSVAPSFGSKSGVIARAEDDYKADRLMMLHDDYARLSRLYADLASNNMVDSSFAVEAAHESKMALDQARDLVVGDNGEDEYEVDGNFRVVAEARLTEVMVAVEVDGKEVLAELYSGFVRVEATIGVEDSVIILDPVDDVAVSEFVNVTKEDILSQVDIVRDSLAEKEGVSIDDIGRRFSVVEDF